MADPDLTPDPLVTGLTPEGMSRPEDVVVLVAYVGRTAGGRTVIYGDPALRTHVQVPTDDIVKRERLGGEEDVLAGRSAIWLRSAALELPVRLSTQETPTDVEEEFLEGDLIPGVTHPTTLGHALTEITIMDTNARDSPAGEIPAASAVSPTAGTGCARRG
jgi:hypothetical protein